MRTAFLAFAVGLALVAPAEAKTTFLGQFMVTNAVGCADHGAGEKYDARYRPSDLSDNGPQTGLSLFYPSGAMNFTKTGRFTTGFTAVAGTSIYSHAGTFNARVKLFSSTPIPGPGLTATTNFVSITGQIENFDDLNGAACVIDFRASFYRREIP